MPRHHSTPTCRAPHLEGKRKLRPASGCQMVVFDIGTIYIVGTYLLLLHVYLGVVRLSAGCMLTQVRIDCCCKTYLFATTFVHTTLAPYRQPFTAGLLLPSFSVRLCTTQNQTLAGPAGSTAAILLYPVLVLVSVALEDLLYSYYSRCPNPPQVLDTACSTINL